jgi:hypothetical protein
MALMKRTPRVILAGLVAAAGATAAPAQTLETETARLLRKGTWKIGEAYEYQTSSEGTEGAVPLTVSYGVTDKVELLLEPVVYATVRPKVGRRATGAGDLETTLSYRFHEESGSAPALDLAAEAKIPTARNALIGTREADFTGYLIASKRFGRLDAHANVSYTWVGQPPGTRLSNIVGFALAGVYRPNERTQVFGEVLGNTGSQPGSESDSLSTGGVVPEAAGQELVGTLGAGRYLGRKLLLYVAVSYDNNRAFQVRPGFTFQFR